MGRRLPENRATRKGVGCTARVEKEVCCQTFLHIGRWSTYCRSLNSDLFRGAIRRPTSGTEKQDSFTVRVQNHCVKITPVSKNMASTTITTQILQGMYSFGLSQHCAKVSLQDSEECSITNTACYQSKCKVLKRQRSSSPELLRCKRRLSFNGLGYSMPPQQPVAVARRNERERNRVKQVNMGFQTLRQHVPNGSSNKKMSKVETLRSAVEYIRALQQLLDEHDAVSAALHCGVPSPTLSNSYSAEPESPHSTYSSDETSYEPLSCEEQELLNFTSWFDRY